MRERAVFVTCLVTAILSGTVLFTQTPVEGTVWLDTVFLLASAICLALGVIFIARRLKRLESELRQTYER